MPYRNLTGRPIGRAWATALAVVALVTALPAGAGTLLESHNENAAYFAVLHPLVVRQTAKGASFDPTLEAVASVQEFGDRIAISFRYDGFAILSDPDNQPSSVVVEVDEGMGYAQAFDLQPDPDFLPGDELDKSYELSQVRRTALDDGLWRLVVTDDHGNVRVVDFVEGWAYDARLGGNQEVPSNGSGGEGNGRVGFDPGSGVLWAQVTYRDLGSPLQQAHIHGPAGSGANSPVLFNLFPTTSATQGDIRRFLDASAVDLGELYKGNWYFNLHTTNFPGGEIRGQIHRIFGSGFQPPE